MSGRLGDVTPAATTWRVLYTNSGSPAEIAVVTVNAVETGGATADIRIAVMASGTSPVSPTSGFIEYDLELAANGGVERSGIVLAQNQLIAVYATTANVNFTAWGITETV